MTIEFRKREDEHGWTSFAWVCPLCDYSVALFFTREASQSLMAFATADAGEHYRTHQ